MPFGRKAIAEAAKEVADQLQVVEHVKALQTAQKELADAIKLMGERIRDLELEMRVLKADTKLEALKETQIIVNGVQGGLNQRIENVAVKVAMIERDLATKVIEAPPSAFAALTSSKRTADGAQP
jgi:hypothetical protein